MELAEFSKEALAEIQVRPVERSEETQYQQQMARHHYLGALGKIGETLWYVATWREQWVAQVSLSASALKCGVRDRWIGWDFRTQYGRLKLIANNSRFLILPGWHLPIVGSRVRHADTETRSSVLLALRDTETQRHSGCSAAAREAGRLARHEPTVTRRRVSVRGVFGGAWRARPPGAGSPACGARVAAMQPPPPCLRASVAVPQAALNSNESRELFLCVAVSLWLASTRASAKLIDAG
jgi:hypothetical protein